MHRGIIAVVPTSERPSEHDASEGDEAWRIVNALFDERAALAEELHQGVQQNLAALLSRLSSMGETADREDMREIRELVTGALDAMRTSINPLVPAARHLGLTTGNLVHFIQDDPKIWDQANRIRAAYDCKPLR